MATDQKWQTNWKIHPLMSATKISHVSWIISIETDLRAIDAFPQYGTLTKCMYCFPLPIKPPVMTYTVLKVMLKPNKGGLEVYR